MARLLRRMREMLDGGPDPVRRLTRAEIIERANDTARQLLGTSREDAFARLQRGELGGKMAEPELRMLYDMLQRSPG